MSSKKKDSQTKSSAQVGEADQSAQEEPISKVSINKYDPFQLKSSIDDELAYVRENLFYLFIIVDRR